MNQVCQKIVNTTATIMYVSAGTLLSTIMIRLSIEQFRFLKKDIEGLKKEKENG